MGIIKKLDVFVLKKFLLIFAGAFFICLFVFMMQLTWKYIDTLIGKGLTLDILTEFFYQMALTLVPSSLPLAVLLTSLITFGNMGEQLELLAMKAAGVPLLRVMRPLFCFAALLVGAAFYFQNTISPNAQLQLQTMFLSLKQTSPAVEIPEGVFYNGVPNINLYVQHKNAETGMLYQVIIYKTDQGFDRAQVVLADSAKLEMASDKMHLTLEMWQGEQFENLQSQGMTTGLQTANVPYDRETFDYKKFIIDFDSNLTMMDADLMRGMASAKNMRKIETDVDSMNRRLDSVARDNYRVARVVTYASPSLARADSLRLLKATGAPKALPFDSVFARLSAEAKLQVQRRAQGMAETQLNELKWKAELADESETVIRRHWIEWHQKMTLSLACVIFFFIGAPLGAIIRKGGLGLPTVISVVIFIAYYLINTSGMKMAREGNIPIVVGMWASSVVLAIFGAFITYKSNNDSVVFNWDAYVAFLRRFFGLRTSRHIFRKEVILEDPRYDLLPERLTELQNLCRDYNERTKLILAPNYFKIFFRPMPDRRVGEIRRKMEEIVEELSNTKDTRILQQLNEFPIIYVHAHTTPFTRRRFNYAAGILFPFGIALWGRIWRFRLRLLRDLRQIVKCCDALRPMVERMAQTEQDFSKH